MDNPKFLLVLILGVLNTSLTVLFAQDTLLKARYISVPYSLISDDQVSLTSNDYVDWKSKIGALQQVYFTSFDINFSESDSLDAYKKIKKESKNFANNFEDTTLLFQNGGQKITLNYLLSSPYSNEPLGKTITFINENKLYVSKIIKKNQIADSVHARHILFQNVSTDKVEKILNDLKNKKISWETANQTYNTDDVAAEKGGDLGYFTQGMMIESFDNLCFNVANIGEYYRVETQFGEHIVQVIDKKISNNSYSIQTLSYITPIILSKKTIKKIETKAQKCIGKSKNIVELKNKLRIEGIELETLSPQLFLLKEIDQWMNKAKNGDITPKPIKIYDEFSKKDKIMLLGIKVSNGKDISNEDLLMQYGFEMLRKKKQALLYQKLKEFDSIESIASDYDVEIKDIVLPNSDQKNSADEMIFNISLQNILFNYKEKKLTKPIIGYNGIYIAYIFWRK